MVEDFGAGVHDGLHVVVVALEIGDEDFDVAIGDAFVDGADGHGEELGAAVLAVVAVDAGDDGVFQAHERDGFGDAARFVHIDFERSALLHGAEAAAASAHVAEDHKRRRALVPAFADVRAGGGFANGVEFQFLDEGFEVAVIGADRGGRFEPLGAIGLGLDADEHYLYSTPGGGRNIK